MASPAIRNKMVDWVEIKDEIGDKHERLVEIQDDLRKMAREIGKKSLTCETDDGREINFNLVSSGEKVKISVKKKPVKAEDTVEA